MIHARFNDLLGLDDDGLHAPGLCSFGGGGGSTNTIQSSTPWSGQQPYLQDIYQQAGYNNATAFPQYYPGNTYAGLTPTQGGLINQAVDYGSGGGSSALRAANSNIASTLSPGYTSGTSGAFGQGQGVLSNELASSYLNPWNSPSFGTVVNNTLASAIPAATSSFTNGNRSDSGLATRAATMAATDAVGNLAQNQYQANQAIQNSAAGQAASNYLTQQGNQVRSSALAPLIDQATTGDLGTALSTAGMSQTDQQNQIQAAMARYNYGQMQPWNQLSLFENAITGTGSPGGTTNTQTPYFSSPIANIASGAIGASTLASAAAQAAGYSGLIGGGNSLGGALWTALSTLGAGA